ADNAPMVDNFDVEECPYPACIPTDSVLVKTLYLSVDPYMRCQMNEDTGADYLSPWKLGEAAGGVGVGVVIKSNHVNFKQGDIVTVQEFMWPWQLFAVMSADHLTK
ncbi:prostaglandin reductase 2-like, partial [Saccoglossus kowalevskii]|uniref:15-oxoprostaglandin 13-reductase n=1 Tax=Saccoglossus kowalevskii TaxID=10224 RepID=A0ABM0MG81_SACKO